MTFFARLQLWLRFFARISYPRDLALVQAAFRRRRVYPIPREAWQIVDSFGGFLSAKEAGLLHHIAANWRVEGPVLELGSYEGRSTIVFARAGRLVYAIDAWSLKVVDLSAYGGGAINSEDVFARFTRNIRQANAQARVMARRGLTQVIGCAWDIPGAILFIDAGHTYADVRGDLDLWTPHLKSGGVLLMHDVLGDIYLDVTRAASELLREDWRVEASAGSIVAFTRK